MLVHNLKAGESLGDDSGQIDPRQIMKSLEHDRKGWSPSHSIGEMLSRMLTVVE